MISDPVARLMLDEAGPLPGSVLVLDDREGVLTGAVRESGCSVRTFCDDIRDAESVPPDVRLGSPAEHEGDAELVLLRLPSSLAALEERCSWIARPGGGPVRLIAGGRVKHMTPAQNEVLGRYFGRVRASLGRDKCRVLEASEPTGAEASWPRSKWVPEAGLSLWAHGGVFGGTRLDAGTALLLRSLDGRLGGNLDGEPRRSLDLDGGLEGGPKRALDFGCGSGILACWLARRGWEVTASDVSWTAVNSTRLTAAANNVAVTTLWSDGLRGFAPGSFDLIVTNPPFHRGAAKDSTPTLDAIADAGSVLAEGGEFWCVFNSHLPYLPALRREIGATRIVARDRHYTVARSVKQGPPARGRHSIGGGLRAQM